MNDVFIGNDRVEMTEGLMNGLVFLRGLYSSGSKEEERLRRHLKEQITTGIFSFYRSIYFNKENVKLLYGYGKRGEVFLSEFHAETEKAAQATINEMSSVVDASDNLLRDYRKVINELRAVLQEREKVLERMLDSCAGQLIRYMLLWDCEDAGYTRYRFVTEGENCKECNGLDGQIFDIKDAASGVNLAPMHPNCDCGAVILDKNGSVVMVVGGREADISEGEEHEGIFVPMLRIPKDVGAMLKEFHEAQLARYQNIKGPLSFLDWLTMGVVSVTWEQMQQRADEMMESPTAYHISNGLRWVY